MRLPTFFFVEVELKSVLPYYLVLPLYVLTHAVFVFSGDPATEQYLQVEGYDFHDRPKFTLNWRYAVPNRSGSGGRRIVVRDKGAEPVVFTFSRRRISHSLVIIEACLGGILLEKAAP